MKNVRAGNRINHTVNRWGLCAVVSLLCVGMDMPVAKAQVLTPTAEDNARVPTPFRADSKAGPGGFAPRGTPQGYTPNPDPRDFTGSYVSGGGGPPGGGAGGAPGGGPPPGGTVVGATERNSCVPSFGSGAYSTHLMSSADRLTVIGEENHRLRHVFIGGQHPQEVQPSYAADSIAHWEGNTLVVDTIAIKGQAGAHLLERWTRQDNGSIEIVTSNLDANGKVQSTRTSSLVWRPDISYIENICEDFGEAFGESYQQKLNKQ